MIRRTDVRDTPEGFFLLDPEKYGLEKGDFVALYELPGGTHFEMIIHSIERGEA